MLLVLLLELLWKPIESFIKPITASCTCCLDVPITVTEGMETELIRNLGRIHCIGQILERRMYMVGIIHDHKVLLNIITTILPCWSFIPAPQVYIIEELASLSCTSQLSHRKIETDITDYKGRINILFQDTITSRYFPFKPLPFIGLMNILSKSLHLLLFKPHPPACWQRPVVLRLLAHPHWAF